MDKLVLCKVFPYKTHYEDYIAVIRPSQVSVPAIIISEDPRPIL